MTSNEQPCPDTYWLPGEKLAAGPYPGFDVETVRVLLDAGIRGFIDLTQEGELNSYEEFLEEEAAERGVEISYSRFAIRDGHAPDPDLMELLPERRGNVRRRVNKSRTSSPAELRLDRPGGTRIHRLVGPGA